MNNPESLSRLYADLWANEEREEYGLFALNSYLLDRHDAPEPIDAEESAEE